jgi:hypothetical protein
MRRRRRRLGVRLVVLMLRLLGGVIGRSCLVYSTSVSPDRSPEPDFPEGGCEDDQSEPWTWVYARETSRTFLFHHLFFFGFVAASREEKKEKKKRKEKKQTLPTIHTVRFSTALAPPLVPLGAATSSTVLTDLGYLMDLWKRKNEKRNLEVFFFPCLFSFQMFCVFLAR